MQHQHQSNLSFDELLASFKEVLRKNGMKYTHQREVIIKALFNSEEHFSPEELYMLIKEEYPELNIGIATVYRTLNLLEESTLATSISFGTDGKKYELGTREHHDHMICIECRKIIEFYDEEIENKQIEIANKYNFKITDHTMQLFGICEDCNK